MFRNPAPERMFVPVRYLTGYTDCMILYRGGGTHCDAQQMSDKGNSEDKALTPREQEETGIRTVRRVLYANADAALFMQLREDLEALNKVFTCGLWYTATQLSSVICKSRQRAEKKRLTSASVFSCFFRLPDKKAAHIKKMECFFPDAGKPEYASVEVNILFLADFLNTFM